VVATRVVGSGRVPARAKWVALTVSLGALSVIFESFWMR